MVEDRNSAGADKLRSTYIHRAIALLAIGGGIDTADAYTYNWLILQ